MQEEILVTENDIEKVKKDFEFYINKISEVSNFLNNELEASFVLLSAARKNIDIISAKYQKDFPDVSKLYQKFADDIIEFENELAIHLAARNESLL